MRSREFLAVASVVALLSMPCLDTTFAVASTTLTPPTSFQPGPGGSPMPVNRDVCWSEPPDLMGFVGSSEVMGIYGAVTQIANDFMFDGDQTIRLVRWWGGYYNNTVPCDPGIVAPGFYIRICHDANCLPADMEFWEPYIEVFVEGSAGESFVACRDGTPLYQYEAEVDLPIAGGSRWWMSIQMADHGYPPQWGRLTTAVITGCQSAFGSNQLLMPPWWFPTSLIFGEPLDFSQEFECASPVPVEPTSWGRIRAFYR